MECGIVRTYREHAWAARDLLRGVRGTTVAKALDPGDDQNLRQEGKADCRNLVFRPRQAGEENIDFRCSASGAKKDAAHVGMPRRKPHPRPRRNRDHRSVSRPRMIRSSASTSTLRSTITLRPFALTRGGGGGGGGGARATSKAAFTPRSSPNMQKLVRNAVPARFCRAKTRAAIAFPLRCEARQVPATAAADPSPRSPSASRSDYQYCYP